MAHTSVSENIPQSRRTGIRRPAYSSVKIAGEDRIQRGPIITSAENPVEQPQKISRGGGTHADNASYQPNQRWIIRVGSLEPVPYLERLARRRRVVGDLCL